MDAVYYLSTILLIIGVPALVIFVISSLIKPQVIRKLLKRDWSRKRISIMGIVSLFIFVIGSGLIINATMPASVRAEIAAQEKIKADAKIKQLTDEQAAKKAQQVKEVEENKPITKTETVKTPIIFSSSEKEDASLAKGQRKITVTGVNGEKTETYEVTYVKNQQVGKKLIKSEVTVQPINEVVSIGTYIAPAPQVTTPQSAAPSKNVTTYYANCSDARAAGAAPIYQGKPGYRSELDRDHDGVACE